jgi:lipid-binding SYLF domain-containing protein
MRFRVGLAALTLVAVTVAPAGAQKKELARVSDAATVFTEIMDAPDGGVPRSVLEKAEGIAIFPGVVRAGFIIGGQFGRGVICVRNAETGVWSAPAFIKIAGGSFGAQIGGQATDLILIIQSKLGVQRLLSNKFKIGGEASVAAGPVGRAAEASTDIQLRAMILSYSRSRGLFAGIAINGSTLGEDRDADKRVYGKEMGSRDVAGEPSTRTDLPESITKLRSTLKHYAR